MNELWNWLNWLLSAATLIAGGGWFFDRKRHRQEVRSIKSENQKKDMELGKMYVDEFKTNIVLPLQQEMEQLRGEVSTLKGECSDLRKENASLRRETGGLRREIKQLKDAIQKINDCPHAADCPVYSELQKQQADDERADQDGGCA